MADDASGAVRRTPRPDEVPELWWSPTVGLIQKMDSFYRAFGGGSERWWGTLLADQFPADAVQLAAFGQRAELTRLQRLVERLPYRQRDYLRARLELRKLNDAMARKNRIIDKRTAERDALQARLDAAHALTEPHPLRHWDTQWPIRAALEGVSAAEYAGEQDARTASSGPTAQGIPADSESTVEAPSAALQGDQPTEPGDDDSFRCCIGPFADGRHARYCRQRCQDCQGDPNGPDRCKCRDVAARATEVADALAADPDVFREDVEGTPGRFRYRQHPHALCGSNVERQQVGDPGHCEDCCSVGHVVAHPGFGCGDVGCYRTHGDERDMTPPDPSGRITDHGPVVPFEEGA